MLFSKKAKPSGSVSPTLRLADFNWPWAARKFSETVTQFQPDSIIVEFLNLAYLIENLDQQSKPTQTIIDTHDMLHKRYQDFKDRGESHWIAIDAAEEAEVLNRFDTVIAIQPFEAEQMAKMASKARVIVCKHACFPNGTHPNVDQFLRPASEQGLNSNRPKTKSIIWAPELNITDSFYRNIDVVVNPIEFGAGLKIKNVEAIAYGKPLITTPHGANGFIDTPHTSVSVANSPEQWRIAIDELSDPKKITSAGKLARQLSSSQFSDDAAYGQLLDRILNN